MILTAVLVLGIGKLADDKKRTVLLRDKVSSNFPGQAVFWNDCFVCRAFTIGYTKQCPFQHYLYTPDNEPRTHQQPFR